MKTASTPRGKYTTQIGLDFKVRSGWGRGANQIKKTSDKLKSAGPLAVRTSLGFIKDRQSALAPFGTKGRIPRSLRIRWSGGNSGSVSTNYDVAFYQEEGTAMRGGWGPPYFIPIRKGITMPPGAELRGNSVFTPEGHRIGFIHPGVRAQHWFQAGALGSDAQILKSFDQKITSALKGR